MSRETDLQEFITDRNEMLLSLDKNVILDFYKKYNIELPLTEEVFWIGIHKARTGATDLPIEERRLSKKLLLEQGFSSFDDGDL